MRINSHASEQYSKSSSLAEKQSEKKNTQVHAKVTTTSFGFRLGKFGVDYASTNTTLDPSLSRDVREKKQQAQAFRTEAEVESLRAQVGVEGADYRNLSASSQKAKTPTFQQLKSGLAAYASSTRESLPLPGSMLAAVV